MRGSYQRLCFVHRPGILAGQIVLDRLGVVVRRGTLYTMSAKKWSAIGLGVAIMVSGGALALGDYVYRTGTTVPCGINDDDRDNSPEAFATPEEGPFPGEGWNKWIGHDLSNWWLPSDITTTVSIPVSEEVTLAGWWIVPDPAKASGQTIIVTHGYGTSRRDYNALLPSSMLVNEGFNVVLVDQRDTGESTCVDGRHSAGQDESSDFAAVADWLVEEHGIPAEKIGMLGISGGGIATSILPAKTERVAAFAIEAPIFDFGDTARREVEFQGFPGSLWTLADIAARLRGVNLSATPIPQAIEAAGSRPFLLLHGTNDQRLAYAGAVQFRDYAELVGATVQLETFDGADHTEGMLSETDRYQRVLVEFFRDALGQD